VDRLDEIRERLSKATPGEWRSSSPIDDDPGSFFVHAVGAIDDAFLLQTCPDADADFIAHSRADLEWAVAEIERLRREVRDLKPRDVIDL
jgi:hypothetical protein